MCQATSTFTTEALKVPVFQKDPGEDVLVCYCFGWTRRRIQSLDEPCSVIEQITPHLQAGRCGCEVNNPQGRWCLQNVRSVCQEAPTEKHEMR
ncbi:MAG: hypothetical protein IGR92_06135 [Leptolyngbyaceae cyanobacterium T60_A2020_046]|nr:hypothetical protein [Leptolyngbyaceae cyanobacterium T60_A2020_046]